MEEQEQEVLAIDGLLGNIDEPTTDEKIEELLGRVSRLRPGSTARRKAVSRFTRRINNTNRVAASQAVHTKSATSKAEFAARLDQLPQEIRDGLANKTLQLVDRQLYSVKVPGASLQFELMTNDQTAVAGKTNLNHRKLEPNKWFMLTAIQVLEGNTAENDALGAEFLAPSEKITNGEFQLAIGGNVIVPRTSSEIFNNAHMTDRLSGYYRLDNPKILAPMTEIKPELWLTAAVPSVKVVLHGSMIDKK
ncbi:MAG TPA: hypothetical protein PLS84_03270 [Salinivirgaceae bacterium]|nr:hypothetical protein [Salinivirgaceae bacterium]